MAKQHTKEFQQEAAYGLTGAQLDFENRLIDLNPHGRVQTKKIRPVVKMPETLAVILQNAPNGHLVTFRGKKVIIKGKLERMMRYWDHFPVLLL